jgi:hypothetical protein
MTSVNSIELSIYTANQFKESVSGTGGDVDANVYLTFGRCYPWNNDLIPDAANTSVTTFYDVWNNMIGAKKITGNDVSHCIPRFNWTANTKYIAYDNLIDSKDLKNSNTAFYVLTDDYNVYKCLSNNYSSNSTVKPTGISTSHFQTVDGYIWKYMYSLTTNDQLRFTTPDYIPVKTLIQSDSSDQWTVQSSAVSGAIEVIDVTNGGTGYTSDNLRVSITGDGTGANAYATRNVTSNTISSITIDNLGTGYTYAGVTITSDAGFGATARAVISPPGGHGSNPLYELGGRYVIINTSFDNNENGTFVVSNDYRQVAIIDNPLQYASLVPLLTSAASQLTVVTLNGTSVDYVLDEDVYQGASLSTATFRGKVADWDSANNVLKLSNVFGITSADVITGVTSTAARFVDSAQAPDMQPYTGSLLYIDNILPIGRAIDQNESFQIVLKF